MTDEDLAKRTLQVLVDRKRAKAEAAGHQSTLHRMRTELKHLGQSADSIQWEPVRGCVVGAGQHSIDGWPSRAEFSAEAKCQQNAEQEVNRLNELLKDMAPDLAD